MKKKHELIVVNQEKVIVTGYISLIKFDEKRICFILESKTLIIEGKNLRLGDMNVNFNEVVIEGFISSIRYE